jgi:hypothetical protein
VETSSSTSDGVSPQAQLRELERATALPYLIYPHTPWWYFPGMGLGMAAFAWGEFAFWTDGRNPSGLVLVLAGVIVMSVVIGAVRSRYGAFPRLRRTAPPEIRGAWARFVVTSVIGCAVLVVVGARWGAMAVTVATFVLVTGGLLWYEHAYARQAAKARRRLALDANRAGATP